MFGPLPPCAAATMPSADFCPPFPAPLGVGSQSRQTDRSPRVWRTRLPPIYPSHLLPRLPDDYRASDLMAFSPRCGCLVCASCSSGRGFAYRFLQTPPGGGSPCGSANVVRHKYLDICDEYGYAFYHEQEGKPYRLVCPRAVDIGYLGSWKNLACSIGAARTNHPDGRRWSVEPRHRSQFGRFEAYGAALAATFFGTSFAGAGNAQIASD